MFRRFLKIFFFEHRKIECGGGKFKAFNVAMLFPNIMLRKP